MTTINDLLDRYIPKTIAESWYVPADAGNGCENYWPRLDTEPVPK